MTRNPKGATQAPPFSRVASLAHVQDSTKVWDFCVIGGGATGAGIALDAASRGYSVAILEAFDWGKGTSSRATKLVHGGVRYLQQGNIGLVREALRERGLLLRNAPHVVDKLEFLIPAYALWELPFYGVGLKLYDFLSGALSFGSSRYFSASATTRRISTLRPQRLHGSIRYFDGQFDDTRLLLNIVQTAVEHGAVALNYAPVEGFLKEASKIVGVRFRDGESGTVHEIRARVTVNAAGPFCDELRRMDDTNATPMLAHSQGVHLVLPRHFLPGKTALMVPRTPDGRVLFAIPWHNHVVVGTTDTPIEGAQPEPRALDEEIEFILETAGGYLAEAPRPEDVLSVFTGIRPLVRKEGTAKTAALARDHTIAFSDSGLLTVTGGKWTTYRKMAEDVVNLAVPRANLTPEPCRTGQIALHGAPKSRAPFPEHLAVYGTDADMLNDLTKANPELAHQLHPDLPYIAAQVVWAARHEMACSVEDVLARRTRALFLNASAALEMAPRVTAILAEELGHDSHWQRKQIAAFESVARAYLPRSAQENSPLDSTTSVAPVSAIS